MTNARRRSCSLTPTTALMPILVGTLLLSCATEREPKPTAPPGLNGDFESKAAEWDGPAGWFPSRVTQTAGSTTLSWDDQVYHGGKRSVAVEIGDAHPDIRVIYEWSRHLPDYEVGATYEVRGWIKCENVQEAVGLTVQCWDKPASSTFRTVLRAATTHDNYPTKGTTEWTEVMTRLTIPEGTNVVDLRLRLKCPDNIGAKVWFDDITVRKTEEQLGWGGINGGFEYKAIYKYDPLGWYTSQVPEMEDYVTFAWDDTAMHDGERSVSIEIMADHPDQHINHHWWAEVREYTIGETYELSGWVRTVRLKQPPMVVIQCWGKGATEMLAMAGTQESYAITGNQNWTRVKAEVTIPEGTDKVVIRAGLAAPANAGGKVWFDDIAFTVAGE